MYKKNYGYYYYYNYYLATEIEKEQKICLFFDKVTFLEQAILRIFRAPLIFVLHNLESSNFLRRCEYIERKTPSKKYFRIYQTLFL